MKLPKGWESPHIGELCDLINGRAFKPSDWSKDGLPIIRIQNLNRSDAEHNYYDGDVDARFLVEPGELLFAWSGTPGTSFGAHVWNGPRAILNQHIFRVRFDETLLDRDFFKCAINSTLEELIAKAHGGVGLAHITRGKFESTVIPMPPLREQRRIIAKLDALTTRLARVRADLGRVPVLVRRLRTQAVQKTFALQGTSNTYRIDELCRVGTGATPKRGESRYYSGGTIPWVTSGAVNSKTVREPSELITEAAIKETNCKIYPTGSLIVALYGEGKTRGKVAELAIDAATNQALAVLHVFDRERIEPNWMRLFLEARYEETREEAAGGVQPNLNLGIIKSIRIPLPSLDEQRTAIKQLAVLYDRISRLEIEASRASALLDSLESAILTQVFRGELLPQDPNDEPASVLLQRIRVQRATACKPRRSSRAAAVVA